MSDFNGYGGNYTGGAGNRTFQRNDSGSQNLDTDTMDPSSVMGGQSLDDIVNQNAHVIRRQSMPQPFSGTGGSHGNMNSLSMLEFNGGSPAGPLDNFQFDPATSLSQDGLGAFSSSVPSQPTRQTSGLRKPKSAANLSSMNSPFGASSSVYSMMPQPGSSFQSPAHRDTTLDIGSGSPFFDQMGMSMDFSGADLSGFNNSSTSPLHPYPQASPFHPSMMTSPVHATNLGNPLQSGPQDPGGGGALTGMSQAGTASGGQSERLSDPGRRSTYGGFEQDRRDSDSFRNPSRSQSMQVPGKSSQQTEFKNVSGSQKPPIPSLKSQSSGGSIQAQQQNSNLSSAQDGRINISGNTLSESFGPAKNSTNDQNLPFDTPEGGWPSAMTGKPHMQSQYRNAYSSTGFDMLGVLMRVATRPNPQINLGSVDLSCAFVVCDAEKDDIPIVYCSDNFERLTGYNRHSVLGRNCRFLQAPDGNVSPGVRRKYVDDDSVLYLKNTINARREAQISLINYRRGGQPFMNLLTTIPITWDGDQVKFFVGFQVDLVEQPNAVTSRNNDGTYAVNYQRGVAMPRYIMNAPDSSLNRAEFGQTVPRDDVSAILTTMGTGESEYAKRMWDKVLLENTDDVVHVLSLKGLFQWVSPSALHILEYKAGELIGTALSSVCHPSDIVPVTRELKDTSSGASVNVVFRIRRKHSGYMWFEGHGSLHTEQGKGRKSIILVGRERPVYTLSKASIAANGGIGEHELWTKISTSGMFLFVSGNVRQLLDRQPEELVGVSIQTLMRAESKQDLARILEHARNGKEASVKHEVINRRGQVLQAFTTLYPGDATEGSKPTFIVAQTRLIRHARISSANKPAAPSKDCNGDLAGLNTPNYNIAPATATTGGTTPQSGDSSAGKYVSTDGIAATYPGQNGLRLGRQDESLASDDNLFEELKTTKPSSWQYEIRQLEKKNRILAEEVQSLMAAKKKRKRRKGAGQLQKDCANCHTRVTPEWRRGPSGQRDLCNSCGLRWAKLNGRVSPRTSSQHSKQSGDAMSDKGSRASASPRGPLVKQESGFGPTQASPSHAANMEGASGVPEKIDEAIEPD